MPIVIVIYILINGAYLAILTPFEMMNSETVATAMATKTVGTAGTVLVPIFVAISCWGSLSSTMMASSRTYMVGAREGHLPKYFSMITFMGNSGTPTPGTVHKFVKSF